MSWFKKKPKSCLGIDIGTSNIKAVELGLEKGKPSLQNYGLLGTKGFLELVSPIQVRTKGLEMLDKEIILMLRRLLQEAEIFSKAACVSIPGFASFSTVIELPEMPEEEVAAAVPFEAKQYVPIPLAEVVLDWKIIGKKRSLEVKDKKTPTQAKFQILIVAVPKETINRYTHVIESCGLKLEALEVESFSLIRALLGNDPTPAAIVDIGARSTDINIIEGGVVRVVRNIEVSGIEFSRTISSGMSITFGRAEKLKEKIGISESEEARKIRELITSPIDRVISEIERMITSYFHQQKIKIKKVILSGASSHLPGLTDYMAQKLNLEIIIGDPFSRVIFPKILKPVLAELGPSLAVAAGLAMKELI